KHILYLNGPEHISSSNERLLGYKKCLHTYHIPFDESLVAEANIVDNARCSCVEAILHKHVEFDAVFAFSDFIAFAALRTLNEVGYRVPVVGVDDILSDINFPVELTSVGIKKDVEALEVTNMLFEQMNNSESAPHTVVLEPFLVNRDLH
ncbi:MAG: LacI family transcriptional regulator, partial [Spirochaetia bacterium]|nr:LacI family transcriptional regulator [Spirochaetia bacterium]